MRTRKLLSDSCGECLLIVVRDRCVQEFLGASKDETSKALDESIKVRKLLCIFWWLKLLLFFSVAATPGGEGLMGGSCTECTGGRCC